MLHVGLTGGLASGKSVVARELERLGCYVIRLDDVGHQVLAPGGEAYAAVADAFGPEILNEDRTIHRRELGRRVFGDPAQLEKLNALVHPLILRKGQALADAYLEQHPDGIAATEAAIMIETGSYKNYDRLIVAACRPEQQVERAVSRGQMTREEALDRMRRQMPIDEKRRYADFVIDTSGTEAETIARTQDVFRSLSA